LGIVLPALIETLKIKDGDDKYVILCPKCEIFFDGLNLFKFEIVRCNVTKYLLQIWFLRNKISQTKYILLKLYKKIH